MSLPLHIRNRISRYESLVSLKTVDSSYQGHDLETLVSVQTDNTIRRQAGDDGKRSRAELLDDGHKNLENTESSQKDEGFTREERSSPTNGIAGMNGSKSATSGIKFNECFLLKVPRGGGNGLR